jgi:hypothetical protein
MQSLVIIGTDVSKLTLDHGLHSAMAHLKTSNDFKGFKTWLKWALTFGSKEALWVIMEHTGYYSYQFELFLHRNHIRYTKVAALEIKRSVGLVRGKSRCTPYQPLRLDAKRSLAATTNIHCCNNRAQRADQLTRQTGKRQERI